MNVKHNLSSVSEKKKGVRFSVRNLFISLLSIYLIHAQIQKDWPGMIYALTWYLGYLRRRPHITFTRKIITKMDILRSMLQLSLIPLHGSPGKFLCMLDLSESNMTFQEMKKLTDSVTLESYVKFLYHWKRCCVFLSFFHVKSSSKAVTDTGAHRGQALEK